MGCNMGGEQQVTGEEDPGREGRERGPLIRRTDGRRAPAQVTPPPRPHPSGTIHSTDCLFAPTLMRFLVVNIRRWFVHRILNFTLTTSKDLS